MAYTTYWRVLKKRRLDLGLSVNDIAWQIRLDPEYIEAIEENRLIAFSGNLSAVPNFVRDYCFAIGGNWNAIANDVYDNVNAYRKRKNIPQPRPQKTSKTSSKSNKSRKKANTRTAKNRSRRISPARRKALIRKRKQRLRILVAAGAVLAVLALFAFNTYIDQRNASQQAQAEKEREQTLAQKERETEKLAEQKQNSSSSNDSDIKISRSSDGSNINTVSNVVGRLNQLALKVELKDPSKVVIYKDEVLLTNDEDAVYSDEFSYTIPISKACSVRLEIGTWNKEDKIFLGNQEILYDDTYYADGAGAIITINIVDDKNDDEENNDTDNQSEDENANPEQDESSQDNESTDPGTFSGNYDYSQPSN